MAANDLSITNVINISVAAAQAGVGEYNTSNLALFSHEPYQSSFGTDDYKIYLSPTEVGEDFGTSSKTYAMANAIFSQKPNILAGRGYLVIIPMIPEVQTITPSAAPASGTYKLNFGSGITAAINWDATAAEIQTAIRAMAGLENVTVTGTLATHVSVVFSGYYGDAALMTVSDNTLNGSITLTVAQALAGESYSEAITRTVDLVQYFGLMATVVLLQAEVLLAAAIVQALNKIQAIVSRTSSDVEVGGLLDLLRSGGFSQSRGLYYGADNDTDALVMMASYMGRGLSTNFDGSNTTSTMHLKDLIGVQPDPSMTQTLLTKCQAAGADVYVSLQGVAKVFCSGKNSFFDQVYNLQWFVGALQVAGFNYLAQTATKIVQTENGVEGLKSAYRQICEQAVTNEYSAPGTWNSATTFGNQSDFLANISQRGYYMYSLPVAQQSQATRAARQAPLVQIALKEAGAIHSSSVVVYVNP